MSDCSAVLHLTLFFCIVEFAVSLRAIIDCFGMDSFNVGMLSLQSTPSNAEQQGSSMLVARIVSRGHSSKVASDFGCLEVSAYFICVVRHHAACVFSM